MAKDEEKEGKDAEKKGGKGKLIIMVAPLVLLIAAVAWFFLLRPKDDAAGPVTLPEPVAGAVVPLDPITINLAGAHFLKLGLALQPIAAAKEVDGSKALDLAISQFSGATIDELSTPKGRELAKRELVARVKLAYLPEGTDLATATGGEDSSSGDKAAKKKSSTSSADDQADSASEEDDTISGADAIKLASKLTVQADVYDVYLTEFVMQ